MESKKTTAAGTMVKLTHPANAAEAAARFIVTEWNIDRGFIKLVCGLPFPPVELVRTGDIVSAEGE
jgi:hypothetical protein